MGTVAGAVGRLSAGHAESLERFQEASFGAVRVRKRSVFAESVLAC